MVPRRSHSNAKELRLSAPLIPSRSVTTYFQKTTEVASTLRKWFRKPRLSSRVAEHPPYAIGIATSSFQTHCTMQICNKEFTNQTFNKAHRSICKKDRDKVLLRMGKILLQLTNLTPNDCQMTLFLGSASAGANVGADLCVRDKTDLRAVVLSRQSR